MSINIPADNCNSDTQCVSFLPVLSALTLSYWAGKILSSQDNPACESGNGPWAGTGGGGVGDWVGSGSLDRVHCSGTCICVKNIRFL